MSKAVKLDPFKTKKTNSAPDTGTVTPPVEVAQAIDAFRGAQEQYKHFEGEMTIYKDQIMNYTHNEYCKRLLSGQGSSFRVLGDESIVTYVVVDASAGLTDQDVSDFAERWGRAAAEELITRDFASIKFDASVLAANYDAVVTALQVLPEEVLSVLFKPMAMKAKSGAADAAKRHAKTSEELLDILKSLKVKNYIR